MEEHRLLQGHDTHLHHTEVSSVVLANYERRRLTLNSYYDQEKGAPTGAGTNETHIENMLFQNFAGTIDECVALYTSGRSF